MKIGASTYSLLKAINAGSLDLLGTFDWLAENGAEHIEIVPVAGLALDANPGEAEAMAAKAAGLGLDISCYTFGASFIDRDAAGFDAELARVKTHLDVAHRLGTKLVRHDVASRPVDQATDERFEQDLPTLVRACRELADYARQYGITTMIENHGFYVQGGRRVRRLCEEVDRDNFRLLVDIGNFYPMELGNTLQAVADCAPLAAMVHVKDHHILHAAPADPTGWRERGGTWTQPAVAGAGDIGIAQAIRSLQAVGFDGYLSLEYEGAVEAREANRQGMEYLRGLLA